MSKQTESPLVVLLPGIYGTGLMYAPLVECLRDEYEHKIISYPTQQVLSYTELVDYVAQRLPQDREFVILAESFSGPIALQLSRRCGERLRAMILVCSFVKNPHPILSLFAPLFLHDRLLAIPPSRFMAKFMITGFKVSKEMLDLAYRIQHMVSPTVFRCRLHEAMRVDVTQTLRELSIPLLHMYAKGDRVIPRSAQRLIKRIRPDLETVALDGPHYLLQTRPEQCMPYIRRFLSGL